MKSYRSIRFLTCVFVIFERLTCKTPTSDSRDLFPVSKTHEKYASVRLLIRDPLAAPRAARRARKLLRSVARNFSVAKCVSGSRIRKRTDAHFSCVLLTGNVSRESEVGFLQVKRPKITKTHVRNCIYRCDIMNFLSKIKRRSASIHIILKKFIPLAVRLLIRDPLENVLARRFKFFLGAF